jgi:nucleoside-diphosphate-sugar epimerase
VVVNNLVGIAFTTGAVHLMSDGAPWRPLVHVLDISNAFLAVLQAPRELVHNQAFNVGRTEENYRIREVAELVREVVPGSEVTFAEGAGPDLRCYRVDCGKLARLPGVELRWTVRRGGRAALQRVQGARPGRRRPHRLAVSADRPHRRAAGGGPAGPRPPLAPALTC